MEDILKARTLQKEFFEFKKKICNFLDEKRFSFAEVPLLTSNPILESSIKLFKTTYNRFDNSTPLYLTPSPEIYLKSLLAKGYGDLYTITKSFRNDEALEGRHNIEFTMLEFYKTDTTYFDLIKILQELIIFLEGKEGKSPKFEVLSISDAFKRFVNIDIEKSIKNGTFLQEARAQNINVDSDYSNEEIFNFIIVDKIEGALQNNVYTFLTDYPSFVKTTAKAASNKFFSQRFELYYNGIEVANCYTEKSSSSEMRSYFLDELEILGKGKKLNDAQERYIAQFDNFPQCAGAAVGIERLFMAIKQISSINNILLFPTKDGIEL